MTVVKKVAEPAGPRKTPRRPDECRAEDGRIGGRIRARRIDAKIGLSQGDLGKLIGVTFQQIQKYEGGKNAVAGGRIKILCRALRVTPNELFDWDDTEPREYEPTKLSMRAVEAATILSSMDNDVQARFLNLLRAM